MTNAITNSLSKKYESDVPYGPSSVTNLFTTAAADNIDHNIHNPTSTTATSSFHGTGISLFQHPSNNDYMNQQQNQYHFTFSKNVSKM